MPDVNERQVGGEHYRSPYQHWDFVCDNDLHYLVGCSTKYIARHRGKNGAQDLEKALHYIDKAEERNIGASEFSVATFWVFVEANQLTFREASAVWYVLAGLWSDARGAIRVILSEAYSATGQDEQGGGEAE